MNKLVIISYANFLSLRESCRKALVDEDVLVSISKEEFIKLNAEEKKKLRGVALTDNKHNATAIETVKPKEPSPKELKFYLEKQFFLKDVAVALENEKKLAQTFYEKHRKMSRPVAPRKIINIGYNSKKKGGR